MTTEHDIREAQKYFPRGLFQPEGSFRFSVDALLLSSFAASLMENSQSINCLDLGAGCGVVGLALLLSTVAESISNCTGLELNEELSQAAEVNAAHLGLIEKYSCINGDVANFQQHILSESYDLIVSNPPYRIKGTGRLPKNPARAMALFGEQGCLNSFLQAAFWGLRNNGVLCIIFPHFRARELYLAIKTLGMAPCEVKPIITSYNQAISNDKEIISGKIQNNELLLIAIKKGYSIPCINSSPLYLYEGEGENKQLSQMALNFCPWLSCNNQRNLRRK